MNRKFISITALLIAIPLYAQAGTGANSGAVAELESEYTSRGAGSFNAAAGKALWNKTFIDAKSAKARSCGSCHSNDLTKPGKHVRSGKTIEAMAPSVNPQRLGKTKKIKKWFLRNCKWTLGRQCTAQEKGDLLAFLKNL